MVIAGLACVCLPATLLAQAPRVHYQHHAAMPPGAIGGWQLRRGGPLPGYFQPVVIRAPSGVRVAAAVDGRFQRPEDIFHAGLLIGSVYRLRITDIPSHDGEELFPTLEIIDRTYPPRGREGQFPIPIEITQNDLELALVGRFITRVTYLEDPKRALPVAQRAGRQEWFDVPEGKDPLQVADTLGRPVAILRIGAREPQNQLEPGMQFLYGCPPLRRPRMPAAPRQTLPTPPPAATQTGTGNLPYRGGSAAGRPNRRVGP